MLTQLGLPQGASLPGALGAPYTASPRGAVMFVLSTVGSDSRSRLTFVGGPAGSTTQGSTQGPVGDPLSPLASVFGTNGALSYAVAGRGDLIIVLPGHTESLTTNGSYAVPAGVTVLGLGGKTTRGRFTFAGGTATTIAPGADSTLSNLYFDLCTNNASINLVKGFNMVAAGAALVNCFILQTMATATHVALNAITVGAADLTIQGCTISATLLTGAASAIAASAACDNLVINDNVIRGFYSSAPLLNTSTFHFTNLVMLRNQLYQANGTAKAVLSLTTSTTGIIGYNSFLGTTWAALTDGIVGASSVALKWVQNYGLDDITIASAILMPAAGTIT